ncbi:MAG TPA: precorrin-4 C(11)-methyltransferase [Streptosporangiaceae bacterium]
MNRLIGVGVGPGDPELVTVKAVRVLREADVVLVPVLAGADAQPGRAESIIRAYVAAGRVRRLKFALNDTGGVTPRRAAAWQAAAAAVAEEFAAGAASVAFATLGDPNLYSTFSYLAQTVRELVPGVTVETVAGITAMQDLASRAGLSLAEGTEPVTLVPLNGGVGALDQALARGGTVVGYKVGAAASPAPAVLRDRLQAAGRLEGAIIGARLGLEDELIAPAAELLRPAPAAPVAPPAPASEFNESGSLPNRFGRESFSTEAPPPSKADIPDIPYLSTLIIPALRAPGVGVGLASRPGETQAPAETEVTATSPPAPHPNHDDVTSPWSGPPRCDIVVVETSAEVPRSRDAATGARAGAAGSSDETAPTRDGSPVGRVVFVGAGPGAPDLLTQRGARAIEEADIVIWASSLVDHRILAHASEHAEIVDSAQLPMEGVLPCYERAAQHNLTVARVHSGDPSLWGAVQEQLEKCRELGLDTEIVPGVSSFTAVAATIGRELTIPEVAQSVILTRLGGGKTPMPPGEQVREFARHGTTMALFLSAARSGQLQEELLQGGYPPDTPCVVAYQVTWPDELIIHTALHNLAATIKERKLWKHTLVLVGPALATTGTRSHLYHPGHFHGYRKAEPQARKQLRERDRS